MSEVGRKLKTARIEAGLTLREASEASGTSKDTISRIERGMHEPRDLTIGKLAKVYGRPVSELLERPESPLEWARRIIPYDPDELIERVRETHESLPKRELNEAYQEARRQELAHLSSEELRDLRDEVKEALENLEDTGLTLAERQRPENAERINARLDLRDAQMAVSLQLQAVSPKEHA